MTFVIYILETTSSQKIKIFGPGNQKFFIFKEFSLQGKLNALDFPYWIKTDWNSGLKRSKFWFSQPNILIFWGKSLLTMNKTKVKLLEIEIFCSFNIRFLCLWRVKYKLSYFIRWLSDLKSTGRSIIDWQLFKKLDR